MIEVLTFLQLYMSPIKTISKFSGMFELDDEYKMGPNWHKIGKFYSQPFGVDIIENYFGYKYKNTWNDVEYNDKYMIYINNQSSLVFTKNTISVGITYSTRPFCERLPITLDDFIYYSQRNRVRLKWTLKKQWEQPHLF